MVYLSKKDDDFHSSIDVVKTVTFSSSSLTMAKEECRLYPRRNFLGA